MDNIPAIPGFDDYDQARPVYFQSGRMVHAPFDGTLAGLAGLDSSPGLVTQIGADAFTKRTLVAPAAGLTISNPAGTAGNPTFALANDLSALEELSGDGLARRTGVDTWALINYVPTTSFTPRIDGATTAGTGTYTTQTGRYARIGPLVFVEITLVWTAHTGTGAILIANLPITILGGSPAASIYSGSLTFSNQLACRFNAGTTDMQPLSISTAAAAAAVNMDTAATIVAGGVYFAA